MANSTPMTISLYDPDTSEVLATHTRCFVPWGILKAAVRLSKEVKLNDLQNIAEEDLDKIAGLVVEAFGRKFSVEDLNEGSDIGDMVSVINTIIAKANGVSGNPTPPVR